MSSASTWSWDDVPDVTPEAREAARSAGDWPRPQHRRDGDSLRRFMPSPVHGSRRAAELAPDHPAVIEGRTLFRKSVVDADRSPRVLVSGHNNTKIGKEITRGDWAGFPIFTLTLEERATCPASCALWAACFGNATPFARRHHPGPALEAAIERELGDLQRRHPGGFAIRVHVLGDFYSLEYLKRWLCWMDDFPALHVWGYTAHPIDSAVGRGIDAGNDVWPDRWAFRFSMAPDASLPAGDASYLVTTIWRPAEADVVPEGLVCPSERHEVKCCGSCGLCWAPGARDKRIVFVGHGRIGGRGAGRLQRAAGAVA